MSASASSWTDPAVLVSTASTVTTVVYVILTFKLLAVTKESIEIARASLEIATRPFVAIVSTMVSVNKSRGTWEVVVEFKNFGKSAAFITDESPRASVGGREIPIHVPAVLPYLVAPEMKRDLVVTIDDPQTMRSVVERTAKLHLVIQITYKDSQESEFVLSQEEAYDPNLCRFYTLQSRHERRNPS